MAALGYLIGWTGMWLCAFLDNGVHPVSNRGRFIHPIGYGVMCVGALVAWYATERAHKQLDDASPDDALPQWSRRRLILWALAFLATPIAIYFIAKEAR